MSDRSRLNGRDLVSTGLIGIRSRRGRTALTALGIAIGVASMVAVVGISSSSKAALLAELDSYGTNLLQVQAATFGQRPEPLPIDAQPMLARIPTVESASAVSANPHEVRRNRHDQSVIGIASLAVAPEFFETIGATAKHGRVFDGDERALPVVVLGDVAAIRLGIDDLAGGPTISIGEADFAVVGVLDELPLHPDISRTALIGDQAGIEVLDLEPNPTSVYVRVEQQRVIETRQLLAATANPATPSRVVVSSPSDLLEARAQVDQNLQNLLLALGGVALLVGGVGIANVMVISVLERRGEIGLRRALGATRGHIRSQFVLEAGLLAGLGGLLGVVLGAAITIVYARRQKWVVDVPPEMLAAGVGIALLIGILAGLYPASKAARLDPALAVSGAGWA